MNTQQRAGVFPLSRRSLLKSTASLAALAVTTRSASAQNANTSSITLSPQPDSRTAWPRTSISFRGTTAQALGEISVTAAESGAHSGIVVDHPDGNGCSFVPDDEFRAGEKVTVNVSHGIETDAYTFQIVQPADRVFSQISAVADEPEAGLEAMHAWATHPEFLVPELDITTDEQNGEGSYIFLTPSGNRTQVGALIVDRNGEPVWYYTPPQEYNKVYDLKVEHYLGQPVLVHAESAKTTGYGFGHFKLLNQAYEPVGFVQAGNGIPGLDVHDILLTDRGSAMVIAYPPVFWDASTINGPVDQLTLDGVVQEIDIATGLVLFEWHSLDHVEIAETHKGLSDDPEVPLDYIHFNSVDIDHDGHLLISARNTHAAYKVSTTTGEVIWRLGGRQSDFTMGEGTEFAWAHDVQRREDGSISLFDNHSDNPERAGTLQSRALFLELDEDAMTATVQKEITHPTEILSTSQSNVQVLEDDQVFVGWGSSPVFSEFTPEGELVYNGRFPTGITSYRAHTFAWVGRPSEPPKVAAEVTEDDSVRLSVSWNGATEVQSWQVLAGEQAADLEVVETVPKDGFETTFDVQTSAPVLKVVPLDADDRSLGESDPVVLQSTAEPEATPAT